MISTFIITVGVGFLTAIFSWLPKATSLPFGIDSALQLAVGYWNSFLVYFWPLQQPWDLFLWYIGVLVVVMVLRLFFKGLTLHGTGMM